MSNKIDLITYYLEHVGITSLLETELTEVVINKPYEILIENENGWQSIPAPNASYDILLKLGTALSVFNEAGDLCAASPIKSLVTPNGERSQFVIPPACESGHISLTIRKPSKTRFTLSDYVSSGRFANARQAKKTTVELSDIQKELLEIYNNADSNRDLYEDFIRKGVEARCNFLVVGGTGSGKTTIASSIADIFPQDRRIITIEDTHEMELPFHNNHVHLFFKTGGVQPKVLIEAAMRMKPDHIFLAELRGNEAWSYIEALNTGHQGSITTIHANNTYASFSRLAAIVKQSDVGLTLDYDFVIKTIKSSIDIILFFNHTHMTEVYFNPVEKNTILSGL
ncbi:P-type DNA transfer ATPase VirB11 [Hafnia paralvei]|uniref:P-type DNA transfer ATPase VirB11 n=1 Tax=Hafnia paralvei TaxID=546367 RepID=UPI002FDC5807